MKSRNCLGTVGLVLSMSLVPAAAWGQEPPPPPPPRPAPPPPPATVAAAPEPAPIPAEEGVTDLPIANQVAGGGTPAPGGITSSTVSAPVVGVRYWLNSRIGIDGGLGIGLAGGSDQAVAGGTSTTVSKTSSTGFALHGGVPIALAEGKHYAFLAIPELTVGFTTATYTPPSVAAGGTGGPNQDLSGFLLDVGARVGAEIYFGFIGIPQLALQATLGLSYRRSVYKWSSSGNSASDGTNTFGTQVNADPWAIFKDAISATYYL
ncbi:MAG TPA: hypothetical protein VHS09_02430 [Polyangiaceae bacterium]|nr:hypothetical protein [Polyangiaceae bacterium]